MRHKCTKKIRFCKVEITIYALFTNYFYKYPYLFLKELRCLKFIYIEKDCKKRYIE